MPVARARNAVAVVPGVQLLPLEIATCKRLCQYPGAAVTKKQRHAANRQRTIRSAGFPSRQLTRRCCRGRVLASICFTSCYLNETEIIIAAKQHPKIATQNNPILS